MPKNTTLVHPDGKRTYETSDPTEVTRLKAHGYTVKQAAKPAPTSTKTANGS